VFYSSPGFTATAILALTLGIGASTAVFSIVNTVLLKPVPFPEPDRLIMLMISQDDNPIIASSSPAQFMHFKAQDEVLDDVTAFRNVSFAYENDDVPVSADASQVSDAYFRTFGAQFTQGRGFTADDDLPGAGNVTVISDSFWRQYLGADPNVLGTTVSLNGDAYTVVGVAGPGFDMREFGAPQLWVPLQIDPNTRDRGYFLQVVARLTPGTSLAQAQARLEASVAPYLERFPNEFGPRGGFSALPLQDAVVGRSARTSLLFLAGAVCLVLLIACANVANLMLVRASGRQREFAIRAALGAGRDRIVQQLAAEGGVLALVSGALGLGVGYLGTRVLLAVDTADLPRVGSAGSLMGLDWRVVLFTVLVSIVTAVAFSLAPAAIGSRLNLVEVVNGSGARAGTGARQSRSRSALVIVEVALAVVLLIGAGLLIRTSTTLSRVDPGFDAQNLLTMSTSFNSDNYASTENVAETVRLTRERIRSIPGVAEVVGSCCSLPTSPGWNLPFNIPGRDNEGLYTGGGAVVFTSPGYFSTFDIPVLRGRAFDESDNGSALPVVIVNEALARQYWPDGDALGDRLLVGGGAVNMQAYADEPLRQVVGIVGNVREAGLAADPGPAMYVPQAQLPDAFHAMVVSGWPMNWAVRTRGDPADVSTVILEELRLTTGLPVTDVREMDEVLSLSVSRQRLHMLLMTVFASSALLLAAIGIFGLVASVVQHRTSEIGVRLALGAEPRQVRRMLVRQGMSLVGLGLAVGLVGAYYLATVLSSILFGVDPHDPTVFVAIPVLLIMVSIAAIAVPAMRASRVDPVVSMRRE
jgi:predicted permease